MATSGHVQRPAAVALSDFESAKRWFATQPREVSVTIAARAALRILPRVIVRRRGKRFFELTLACFRASGISWATARFPDLDNADFRAAADAAATSVSSAYLTDSADASAVAAAIAANEYEALEDAAYAAGATKMTAPRREYAVADATSIEDGISPSDLAKLPLWQGEVLPRSIAESWARLKNALLAAEEGWEVWIDWYEDRIAGRPADPVLERARFTIGDELWKQGPKAVNARIKELITEQTPAALPVEEGLPAQVARAAVFQPEPSGVIGLAPPKPADRLADTSEVRDLYGEVREKLDNLIALGRNMLGDRLDRSSDKLRSRMPQEISEAVERLVWSSGNTLRSILAGHDAIAGDRDPHPDKLDQGVVERLRDAVDTFNQLAIADPALRLRDAGRPGPQEHGRTLDEINIVIEVSTEAAADRNITTVAAGEQLSESAAIVIEAGSSLTERLAVELARDTNRNFVAGVVVSVYRMLRNLPALARGEGGFISKEYFGGFYKYAGGATVVALAGGLAGAYSIRWEIVEFIVSHADQFRLYAAYAFEQSPGLKQMIDWLETHVQLDKKRG